ncbi:MAG: hypothetical protein ACI8PT_000627 [Gammaproteobacteria bacterium]|jgi:hypothetical protein
MNFTLQHHARLMMALTTVALLLGTVGANGQQSEKDPKDVTGFLKVYSDLAPFKGDPNVLVWIDPKGEFKQYKKFLIEQPFIYIEMTPKARSFGVRPDEFRALTEYLRNAVIGALEDKYDVVDQAGIGVARLRLAISGVTPTEATGVVTKSTINVDHSTMEAELTDSFTEKRLAAVIDTRVGNVSDAVSSENRWRHTKAAFRRLAAGFRNQVDSWHDQ